MNVYRVYPRVPVYDSPYVVAASDFNDAEQKVLAAESSGGGDCQGIVKIELVETYDPETPSRYIGFGAS